MKNKFTSGAHEVVLKRIRDIPSLPEVVNRILEILTRPGTSAAEVAKLIALDPGLTSKVLRMVNSAAYGFQRQISSIQHGIMILGFNNVRGLVLSASIFKLFEAHSQQAGLDHRLFWEHSLGTAMAGRILAQKNPIPDADDVFSAGMLHDIGKIVLDVYFPLDYNQVIIEARRRHIPLHGQAFLNLEEEMLGLNHTDIGSFLAAKWKLPRTISEVIQFHHRPADAVHCQPLVHLVALANELAVLQYEKFGIYVRSHFTPELLDYFSLDDARMQQLLSQLKADMTSADELLSSISSD